MTIKKILKVIWLVVIIPALLGLLFILLGIFPKEVVVMAVVIAIIVVGVIVYYFRDAYKL